MMKKRKTSRIASASARAGAGHTAGAHALSFGAIAAEGNSAMHDPKIDSTKCGSTKFGNAKFGNATIGNARVANTRNGNARIGNAPFSKRARGNGRKAESGYALLMVIFFAALMLVAASTVGLKVATQGQREKELDLEWRGKQYVRGVKMFSRKNGRFPHSIEELVKPSAAGVRFMRKEYKDPFNTGDGSWRFIYVGPAGQLIGSTKTGSRIGLLPGVAGAGVKPVLAGATPAGAISSGGMSGGTFGSGISPDAPANAAVLGQRGTRSALNPRSSTDPKGASDDDAFGFQSVSTGVGSDGKIIGGNIIGVASKIDKKSIRVYDGGQTYREWEFIYDPSKDRTAIGQPGTQLGVPAGGAPGITPFGTNPNGNSNQNPFRRQRPRQPRGGRL